MRILDQVWAVAQIGFRTPRGKVGRSAPPGVAPAQPPNAATDVTNFIRIDGLGSDPCLPGPCTISGGPHPNRDRVMTCVAQDFACGINPVIPPYYLTNQACVHNADQIV